jgi:hypothetical protein
LKWEWPEKEGSLQFHIRKALLARITSGDFPPVSFEPFEEA